MRLFEAFLVRLAILVLFFLFLGHVMKAHAFDIIKFDEFNVDYKNYSWVNSDNHQMLIYPETAKESMNLGLNTDLLKYGYADLLVETTTTSGQYRGVGLQVGLGIRVSDYLKVGYYHHSQHVLDRQEYYSHFPVEDAIQIQLIIFKASEPRKAIF